jgi:3-keto-5-aminohexanoate cleavage enzyme
MNALDGKVVIEVRCNEYTMRDRNPHVPWSPDEIAADAAACREAGASVVHFHARDPETGAMSGDVEVYAATIRAVRSSCDVLLNPTLGASTIADPSVRVAHIPVLARDPATRPELAPVDLGSFNIDPYDPVAKTFRTETLSYVTDVAGLRHEIETIRSGGVAVQPVLWTVGSARLLGAFCDMGVLPGPVYAHIALSGSFLSAHPPTVRGLVAMVDFLPSGVDLHWTFSAIGANALGLVSAAVELGGHVNVGLGDHPHLELGSPTNAQVVAEAVRMIRAMGKEPATPAEVREAFGITTAGA